MATAGTWSAIQGAKLHPTITSALTNTMKFPNMTPVQAAAIPPLLTCKDVCVDAETGSGKTLSFLVPIAQMILFGKDMKPRRQSKISTTVMAIVLVPTRELAGQVHAVAVSLFSTLPGNLTPVPLIGGSASTQNGVHGAGPDAKFANDHRLIVATPGRLSAAIAQNAINYSKLDILILDEADRLLDMGFAVTLTDILVRLPKQRRTGIYSATQTAEVESLARAGLRNPVRVAVRMRLKNSTGLESSESAVNKQRIPATLSCYYNVLSPRDKLQNLLEHLVRHPSDKMIVYFLTCACVDYFRRLPLYEMLSKIGKSTEKRTHKRSRSFIALHGKLSQKRREKALAQFSKSSNAVLLCTDVAARGIDIPDVDWVVQFDPPQDPDAYIHRVGRTARLGRDGNALLYLAPNEEAYIDFLKIRKCPVRCISEIDTKPKAGEEKENAADSKEEASVNDENEVTVAATLIRKATLADRAVLEASEAAFLSYIRAYKEHKCRFLLKLDEVDINSIADSFGLLRLPRFHEFRKLRKNIVPRNEEGIDIKGIAFKDVPREQHRQKLIQEAVENRVARKEALQAKSKKGKKRKKPTPNKQVAESAKVLKNKSIVEEDFGEEAAQLRKLKRGKISQEKFDSLNHYMEE